jgi:hypothetical protein
VISSRAIEQLRADLRDCHDHVSLLRAKLYRWGLGSNAQLQRLEVELEHAQQRLSDATARYSSDRTNGRYAGVSESRRGAAAAVARR